MRKTNKTMSIILVLAMVMTLFAGIAQASTFVSVGSSVPNIPPAANQILGRIDIAQAAQPAVAAGDQTVVTVTLPTGVTFENPVIATITAAGAATSTITRVDAQTARFTVVAPTTTSVAHIRISGIQADVAATYRGDVNAIVVIRSETTAAEFVWEQTATVRIANVLAPGTTSTALATLPLLKGVANQPVGDIRIVENVAGSLTDGANITLTAPAGVVFTATGLATMTVTVPTATAITTINVTGIIVNVGLTVPDGPMNIAIAGAGATAASVQVGTVGEVGVVAVSAVTPPAIPSVFAGRLAEAVANIRLTENMPDAFAGNRVLTLALPAGFTWNSATSTWATPPSISADGRTLTFWTIPNPAPGPTFDLTGLSINTHITAPAGAIVVTVDGNTGARGTVTVATLVRPVTLTVPVAPNIRADSLNQPTGNLVITEGGAGALIGGQNLVLTLPLGVTVVGTPAVAATVPAGGTAPTLTVTSTANIITIQVATSSAVHPATVTLSGIRINLDRVFPGTPITATVTGAAVLEDGATAGLAGATAAAVATVRGTVIGEVVLANVITRTARRTVFTIDSIFYSVDGVMQVEPLDVAPRIVDNRTIVPLRAAANAAGVTNDNILFHRGVITIMRGDRIVQFTLGSEIMLINGIPVTMDTVPVLEAGRTLLPVFWVSRALGVPILWDAVARTVTVSVP